MQPQEATPSPLASGKRVSHNFVRHTPLRNFAFHKQASHKAAVVERRAAAVDTAGRTAADRVARIAAVDRVARIAVAVDKAAADTVGHTAVDTAGRIAAVDTVVVDTVGRTDRKSVV